MGRPPIAQKTAEEFLWRLADGPHDALGVAELAARAGVSYVTMWKAVKRLKASGTLRGTYRVSSGTVPLRPVTPPRKEPPQEPHQRIQEQLTRDLLDGTILRGINLLSVKELTARYRTSPRSLRRVLAGAMEQGLIVPRGRHWSAFGAPGAAGQSIVLVACMAYDGSPELPVLERDFLRACEIACIRAQVPLRVIALRGATQRYGTLILDAGQLMPPVGPDVAGYVYIVQGPEVLSQKVMDTLLSANKPVAILDNGADVLHGALRGATHSDVRVFNASAHRHSGIDVAAYLLSKGHRHIAYISPFHADSWSQLRCAGIASIVGKAGPQRSLRLCTLPHSLKDHFYADQGTQRSGGAELQKSFSAWLANAPASFQPDALAVMELFGRNLFMAGEIRQTLESLLDEAARDSRITAWIMANDLTARMAVEYCRRKGLSIPQQISVIGFDDEIESCEQGLTSYSFNFDAAATTIVHYLLHPHAKHWVRHKSVELRGTVMPRATG